MFWNDRVLEITISGNPHIGNTSFHEVGLFLHYVATTVRDYVTMRIKLKGLLRILVVERAKFQAGTDWTHFRFWFNKNSPFIRLSPTIIYIALHFLMSVAIFGILHNIFRYIYIYFEKTKKIKQLDKNDPVIALYNWEMVNMYGPKKYWSLRYAYYIEQARIEGVNGPWNGKYNEFYYTTEDFLIQPIIDFSVSKPIHRSTSHWDFKQNRWEWDLFFDKDYSIPRLGEPLYRENVAFMHAVYADNVNFFIKAYKKRIAWEKKIEELREKENYQITKNNFEMLENKFQKETKKAIQFVFKEKTKENENIEVKKK